MRIAVFTMAYWDNPAQAKAQSDVLNQWAFDVRHYYNPRYAFVASGTWSDPLLSPLYSAVPVVNAGAVKDRPYDAMLWSYFGAALTAALCYALNRRDWDMLILHDTDMLVGAVDFDALLHEFMSRKETFLCADWHGRPCGGSITVWKPAAASRWLNHRMRPNFYDTPPAAPMLLEDEMGYIFEGQWWNPWPHLATMRQDYGHPNAVLGREPIEKAWPFVRLPDPSIVSEFKRTQTALAKPVQQA